MTTESKKLSKPCKAPC